MVGVYTIEGDIRLNTGKFNSAIRNVTAQLETLASMELGVTGSSMIGELETLKQVFRDIGTEAKAITESFAQIKGLNTLLGELETIKERIASIKNDVGQVQTKAQQTSTAFTRWNEILATVSPNFQGMMHSMEAIQGQTMNAVAELGSLRVEEGTQIKKNLTYYEQELQVAQQFKNAEQGLIRGYAEQGQMLDRLIEKGQRRIQQLEREMQEAKRIGSAYLEISREQNRQLTFEREMVAVEEQFSTVIGDEIASKFQYNAILEESVALEKEILSLMGDTATMTGEEIAEETKKLNTLRQELDLTREINAIEKEQIGLISEENALLTEQNALNKGGAKGNKLDKFGYLPSRIGSMAVTMLGYQEIMDVWEKTTTNINAKGSYSHFGRMLQTDERYLKQTGQTTDQVRKSLGGLDGQLRTLQGTYKKIDMKTVGANAEETAFKYGLQADAIGDLSEVMAIYGSEFVKQGRSQEDSILALNDALDGELRRLKEVNVTSDELKEHGWKGQGDQVGMIKALKEIAEERGYDVTAKEITNLSDAITYAELQLAFLLSDLFEIAEPSLRSAVMKLATGFEWLGKQVAKLKDYLKGLPQPVKTFLKEWGANSMIGLVGLWMGNKIWGAVSNIELFGNAWGKLMEKLGRTKGIDKATESMGKLEQTTGGTAKTPTGGNWKDGLKNWGKNLAKNLGKMAEVFIEVAVALVMAWALLKEAILLIEYLGNDFEKHKDGFNKGWAFLKDFGVWILGVSAVLTYFLMGMSATEIQGWGAYKNMGKGFLKLAEGLVFAMLLISEAILLLIAPMTAIELLGYMYGTLNQDAIAKGNEVIGMYANALHYIASDGSIQLFILGLGVASAVLGFTADTVAIPLVIGIATALGLVAEAIVMLIAPLVAIEMLGEMANTLNEDAVKKGAESIGLVARVLKALEPCVSDLLAVDFEVFGDQLVNLGNKILSGGKDGLTTLVEDILPSISDFVSKFNSLEFEDTLDSVLATNITQTANSIVPIIQSIQKLTTILGGGDVSVGLFGGLITLNTNSGIRGRLDSLYEDISAVMDFAEKLGNLKKSSNVGTTAITQTSDAIAQLKAKLDQFVSTISSYASKIQSASNTMGQALPNGFKTGSASFGSAVISVLANGIAQIQARYNTFHSGGKTLGDKLSDGFEDGADLKSSTTKEIGYALTELDNAKDDFYTKGKALGSELTRGYEDGAEIHSPGLIARTTVRELRYTMDALDIGKKMMYQGGVALGQALTNGYNSTGNIRTNVDVLASKGISNEQLQATARNIQANTNKKGQTQQSLTPVINIDMSNSTVIGVQDLDARIRASVEKAIVNINSPNGAIGY